MGLPSTIKNTSSEIINVFKEEQQRGESVLSFEKNCKTPKLESHVIWTKRVSKNTHVFGASSDNLTGKDDEETLGSHTRTTQYNVGPSQHQCHLKVGQLNGSILFLKWLPPKKSC